MRERKTLGPLIISVILASLVLFAFGCSDDDNGTGSNVTNDGQLLLLLHDAPVDTLAEVWLTVTSVRLIGGWDEDSIAIDDKTVLTDSIRLDLMTLDGVSTILSMTDVPEGSFSKIRFEVADPEFVSDGGVVIPSSQIKLVANGKIDLNFQGNLVILPDTVNIVDLDLDLESSVQINVTGNERFQLHPQVFVTTSLTTEQTVLLEGATISAIDITDMYIEIELPGSTAPVTVKITGATEIFDAADQTIGIVDLLVGDVVDIEATLDPHSGKITATEVKVLP